MNDRVKKVLAGMAALGALALGGSAIAGAAQSDTKGKESEATLAPADAKQAKSAAVAKVGSGKATEVSAEKPDPGEKADKPEKGEQPDPAYENRIAYDVEVTKADGSVVDVALDEAFNVLGTEAGHQDEGGDQAGHDD